MPQGPQPCFWQLTTWFDYDDVIQWKHFPRYLPFVRGIHRSPVNSPHKGQWRGALMSSLICAWINGWVNTRNAGYLRRHHAHYDVILVFLIKMYVHGIESFVPGVCGWDLKWVIFKHIHVSRIYIFSTPYENALRWIPENLTNDWSTLIEIIARCRQAILNHNMASLGHNEMVSNPAN